LGLSHYLQHEQRRRPGLGAFSGDRVRVSVVQRETRMQLKKRFVSFPFVVEV